MAVKVGHPHFQWMIVIMFPIKMAMNLVISPICRLTCACMYVCMCMLLIRIQLVMSDPVNPQPSDPVCLFPPWLNDPRPPTAVKEAAKASR